MRNNITTMRSVGTSVPSRAQLAAALNALGVPLFVADLEDGELLFANAPFRSRFEMHDRVAMLEQGFAVAPSARFPKSSLIDEHNEPREAQIAEFHHLPDQRAYLVRAVAIHWTPRCLARLHAFVDITTRADTERFQRTQQEKLLLTSRLLAVGELAATLAHELNQPLGAITNYVQGAIHRLRTGANDVEGITDALRLAHLQADHAAKVVSRMREFVRAREPHREQVSIAELVNGIAELIQPEAQKHRVKLSIELPEDPPTLFADRVMIEQVLLNLVKNAIEAMQDTPAAARKVSIRVGLNTDGLIEMTVEDAGCGLSTQAQEQVFSPFFTTKPDGMGIGLSICRSIVEYHGGGLFFASNANGGARFWFTLAHGV